jgi:hypothetical protein
MTEEAPTINLKILSPSSEVEGGVSFSDLPASITIKELRSRIQDAVPSRPAPERMRLIYRGRVVANDADTLGHVFGAENVCGLVPGRTQHVADGRDRCEKVRTRACTWFSESCLPATVPLRRPLHAPQPRRPIHSGQRSLLPQPALCRQTRSARYHIPDQTHSHKHPSRTITIITRTFIITMSRALPIRSRFRFPPRSSNRLHKQWPWPSTGR